MRRSILRAMIALSIPAAVLIGTIWGDSRHQRLRRAEDLKAEAERLERAGHVEEAERVWREAGQLLETLERPEVEGARRHNAEALEAEIRELNERLEVMAREAEEQDERGDERAVTEIREEMEHVEREIAEINELLDARHGHEDGLAALDRRIAMAREAAGILEEAGMGELAHAVFERSEEMEESLAHRQREEGGEEEFDKPDRRIAMAREAAGILEAAGMEEFAREVFHRSEEVERELVERIERREREGGEGEEYGEAVAMIRETLEMVHELRAEVKELSEEVRDLRKGLDMASNRAWWIKD